MDPTKQKYIFSPPIMYLHDPLLEYEKTQIQAQKTHTPTKKQQIWKYTKFLVSYFALSGTIFVVLMGAMNFNAYSARVSHWVNPETLKNAAEQIQKITQKNSIEVHAAQLAEEAIIDREVAEDRVAITNPERVFSRFYTEESLLANIPKETTTKSSFQVTPFENRIIIPRIGKNIPLIDVFHDEGSSYTQMHEIFMEELKKGIVRYPGTAKPGDTGNVFIFGHSSNYPWIPSKYNDVFALLDTLQKGDEIIVYYNQKKYVYRVSEQSVVKPGDTQVLHSRDQTKKEISLMTCWPIGTTAERLIIFGELVETSTQETTQNTATVAPTKQPVTAQITNSGSTVPSTF